MMALLVTSMAGHAEPAAMPLQIRLVVVEGCTRAPGVNASCPVPAQYSEAQALPAQIRELAPPPQDEGSRVLPEPPTVYY